MSSAAKGTLITSVLQSLPTYAMGIFKFPAGLLEKLTKIVRDFWWGDEENRRRMHWMAWDRLAWPKYQGGVGFRDLKVFNQALLARQAWRLIQFPDSLCARLLKARYYPSGNLLDTAFIQNSSTTWQGIIYGLELLKKGVAWRIGNGSSVRIFRDNWLPRVDDPKVAMKRRTNRRRWVSELINPDTRSWDERLIREISYAHDADMILSIKLPMTPCDDFVAWLPEKNGMFTVSSAYRLGLEPALIAMSPGQSSSNPTGERRIWDLVWKAKVPPKLRVFAWKAATETLDVKVAFHRCISIVLPTCTICGCGVESVHHALVTCTLARALREGMRSHWDLPTEEEFRFSGKEWILNLLLQARASQRDQVIFLLWRVWHHRNNVIHGDGKASIAASIPYLRNYVESFRDCTGPAPDPKGKTPLLTSHVALSHAPKAPALPHLGGLHR
jgi:hypothetical protein